MPHDILGEAAGAVLEGAADLASDTIHRRWGWKGCLASLLALVSLALVVLWAAGAFG